MNSAVKMKNPDAFIGRSIQPDEYRNIFDCKMDKVEDRDNKKDIIQENLRLMDCRSFKKG
jgi:hypothetical protein